jgi:hypothetical protein
MARPYQVVSTKLGWVESLDRRQRCGCRPCAFQMRRAALALIRPICHALAVPWVVSAGGPASVLEHALAGLRAERLHARGASLVAHRPAALPAPNSGLNHTAVLGFRTNRKAGSICVRSLRLKRLQALVARPAKATSCKEAHALGSSLPPRHLASRYPVRSRPALGSSDLCDVSAAHCGAAPLRRCPAICSQARSRKDFEAAFLHGSLENASAARP